MAAPKQTETRLYSSVYSPSFLSLVYDFLVLRFNLSYAWGCPLDVLLPFFTENFSRRHLDVGVATGYFPSTALGRPFRAQARQQLVLVDLNPNPLEAARRRILSATTATSVETVAADVTAPLPAELRGAAFDSVSMFNLFHCVPGGAGKLAAFATYKHLLAEGGVLTGCSVLGGRHARNWFSYYYLKLYNHVGVFHNWDDTKEEFDRALGQEFEDVETCVVGMVILFRASKPRKT